MDESENYRFRQVFGGIPYPQRFDTDRKVGCMQLFCLCSLHVSYTVVLTCRFGEGEHGFVDDAGAKKTGGRKNGMTSFHAASFLKRPTKGKDILKENNLYKLNITFFPVKKHCASCNSYRISV